MASPILTGRSKAQVVVYAQRSATDHYLLYRSPNHLRVLRRPPLDQHKLISKPFFLSFLSSKPSFLFVPQL